MTLAAEKLKAFADWLDKSSAQRRSPMGDAVLVGRYAEIIPVSFDDPPPTDFDPMALPLFVSVEQAADLTLPDVADVGFPFGQLRPAFRLGTIAGRVEDAAIAHMTPWHGKDGNGMPVVALIALTDPLQPISAAISAAGGDGVDLDAVPLLACPLWEMLPKERAEILTKLPVLPNS